MRCEICPFAIWLHGDVVGCSNNNDCPPRYDD